MKILNTSSFSKQNGDWWTKMISLFVLFSQIDPSLAADPIHRNTDGEPYGIHPPLYPFDPHPASTPEHIVHSNRPIVCNNNTEFECICMQPYTSPHSKPITRIMDKTGINPIPDCSLFIKTDDLPVVDMRMRQVNTEALLYTGMSYEEYFKKRISSIVSHYCQHNTHECPGTTLRMSHVSQENSQNPNDDDDDLDKSVLYAERDETEPLLTQENVVILRMDHLRGNVTRLLFVLTKNDRNGGIVDDNMIIDPIKVKYILASQVGPLSRVLGGIKIDSVRAAKLKRNSGVSMSSFATPEQRAENTKDNSKLVKGLLIVCAFFLFTYLIACIQCLRYFHRKRQSAREAKQAESGLASAVETKNYGTCENPRKISRNGHVHIEERVPLTYEQIDENANEEPAPLTERQTRNWFMCDSSQLPREATFDIPLETRRTSVPPESIPAPTDDYNPKKESPILTKREAKPVILPNQGSNSSEEMFPPSKDFSNYVDDQYHKSRASSNSPDVELPKTPQEDPWDEHPVNKNIPPVVLLQSETPEIPHINHITNDSSFNEVPKVSLKSESPSFARPRSRRGSRVDEEEGTLDIPELKALHYDDPLAEPLDAPIPPENIKTEIDQEDRWSSSEEGEVDVYFKMSDDEDVTREELDWKKALAKAELEKQAELQGNPLPGSSSLQRNPSIPKKAETPPSSPIQNTHTNMDTDSEDDDDLIMSKGDRNDNDDLKEEEAFVYERLREELSPQPPIVVDLDTTDLDLDPIKAMPPPPPGMYPDSPPESGIGGIFNMQRSQEMSNSSDDDEDSIR